MLGFKKLLEKPMPLGDKAPSIPFTKGGGDCSYIVKVLQNEKLFYI